MIIAAPFSVTEQEFYTLQPFDDYNQKRKLWAVVKATFIALV
jgi:hypothetical protein